MRRALLLVTVTLLALAGCDSGTPAPPAQPGAAPPPPAGGDVSTVVSAFEKVGSADAGVVTVTLQSDPASLAASSESLKPSDAKKLLSSSLTIASKGDDSQVAATVAGADAFEMRVIGKVIYLRMDLERLITTFGGDPSDVARLRNQAPPGLDFLEPLLNGEFVAIRGYERLSRQMGGGSEEQADLQKDLVRELVSAVEANAQVTSAGSDEKGEHFVVGIPLRQTYEALSSTLGQLAQGTPLPPASEVPDATVPVDVWIRDGSLTQVEIDFVKVGDALEEPAPKGVKRLALRLEFDTFKGAIQPPTGAVEVDVKEILQGFTGAVPGAGGGGGGGGVPPETESTLCEDLKQVTPPEDLDEFAGICPEFKP